jgi:glycogen debranching enzyme GlgX
LSGRQVTEFKMLVRELHKAGIELILDVVYNHSGEGNEMGPTLCFKGIDNPTYYCLTGDARAPGRYYENFTGCGNSLDFGSPHVIRFVMDSLRYWVEVMHVDGFRFDLASVLGREDGVFRGSASFFDAIAQDPVLSRAKLIAEPWDTATYQVGNFPIDWSEWNGRFRDTVRKFGKGDGGQLKDLGWRLTGSADLYGDDGRSAYNSLNFVTCHDGFTLYDLVSYSLKHNEANQEQNRDGSDDNNSWNCGVRRRHRRSGHHRPAKATDQKLRVHAVLFARDANDARWRRVLAHAAWEQQCVLPGQRDQLVRLGAGPAACGYRAVLQQGDRVRESAWRPASAKILSRQGFQPGQRRGHCLVRNRSRRAALE